MGRHHVIAHLTGGETTALFRSLADQSFKSGNGIRVFAWRRFAIILETNKQPNRPTVPTVPLEDLFGTEPSEESS